MSILMELAQYFHRPRVSVYICRPGFPGDRYYPVMRWLSIILILAGLSSCTALKPVVSAKPAEPAPARESQPVFIEHISTNPQGQRGAIEAKNGNKGGMESAFTMEGAAAGIYSPLQFKYAILMDVPIEALTNTRLFSFIDDWYGTPYRFGGNAKTGIDCSAFTGNLCMAVFGISLPRMARDQYNACDHLSKDELTEGDLVFFHTTRKGISHVGIYLGNNKFVHASVNFGVVISDLNDPYYSRAFRSGGRFRQVETASGN